MVARALFTSAESLEVLSSLGGTLGKKLESDALAG